MDPLKLVTLIQDRPFIKNQLILSLRICKFRNLYLFHDNYKQPTANKTGQQGRDFSFMSKMLYRTAMGPSCQSSSSEQADLSDFVLPLSQTDCQRVDQGCEDSGDDLLPPTVWDQAPRVLHLAWAGLGWDSFHPDCSWRWCSCEEWLQLWLPPPSFCSSEEWDASEHGIGCSRYQRYFPQRAALLRFWNFED